MNTVAQHILNLAIDPYLEKGDPEIVDRIAIVKFGDKTRDNFSFASKYCSWHNSKAYPIYDGQVEACLWQYRKQDRFTTYPRSGYRYPEFVRIMTAFRDSYGLATCSFKQLDKFLWSLGREQRGVDTAPTSP